MVLLKQSLTGSHYLQVKGDELQAPATKWSSLLGGLARSWYFIYCPVNQEPEIFSCHYGFVVYSLWYFHIGMVNALIPLTIISHLIRKRSISILKRWASAAFDKRKRVCYYLTTKNKGKSRITNNTAAFVGASKNVTSQEVYEWPILLLLPAHGWWRLIKCTQHFEMSLWRIYPVFTKANRKEQLWMVIWIHPMENNVNYIDKVFRTVLNQKHNVTVQEVVMIRCYFALLRVILG